ncbi:MAG: dTMP kinase [Kiritimatiellae bacterium]|nr:dTMP kinase [Kiritimatiellia bacterium]
MRRGKFITFEGPEGSGKSTHIRLLADFLRGHGVDVKTTREPGGTALGESIRGLLQHNHSGEAPVSRAEVLLFLASRAQHVESFIRPALAQGCWVLCDRFEDSTFAYQGYGRGFDLGELRSVNIFATDGLCPDLTVLLDVDTETGRDRLKQRHSLNASAPDRIERECDEFHLRLREGFLEIAHNDPQRFIVVSTNRAASEVAVEIRDAVCARMKEALDAC